MEQFEFIPKSRRYLNLFCYNKKTIYYDVLKNYKVGYGDYYRKNDLIDCMYFITGNLEENFEDIEIPNNYPTVNKLIEKTQQFLKQLESYDELFIDVLKYFKDKKEDTPLPVIKYKEVRNEVREAFTEFNRLANIEGNFNKENANQQKAIDVKKLTIPEAIKETGRFIVRWDIGTHVLLWPSFIAVITGIVLLLNKCNSKSKEGETNNLIQQIEDNKELISKYKSKLDMAFVKIDSLETKQNGFLK